MDRKPTAVPFEELRLALVLNGGVSLAVWMGGTVRELDGLARAHWRGQGSAVGRYAAVLDLVRTWASVDVISGTSAGGINGAALALSRVNKNADLAALRDLWAEQGHIDNLLRPPFRGQPTSLLRGDEYFLPELTSAMRGLTVDFDPTYDQIDLTITTTLLDGALSVTTDALGQQLPQRHHAARFRFSTQADSRRRNDFAPEQIVETSAAMALAARCTAGFPFAFEPSFVPVREGDEGPDDPGGRPNMWRWASWADSAPGSRESRTRRDRSRFAVDGGLLANTPTREALDAIDRQPVGPPMRRALMLVFPHAPAFDPGDPHADPPDLVDDPPTVTDALGGMLSALTSQGSLTFVDEIDAHNRRASQWRGGRLQVLQNFTLDEIYALVGTAWRLYQSTRIRAAARSLADRVPRPEGWDYARVVRAAAEGQRAWARVSGSLLPYIPRTHPQGEPPHREGAGLAPSWSWGTTVALGIADAVAEILREAQGVAVEGDELEPLTAAVQEVSAARDAMLVARDSFDESWWHQPLLDGVVPGVAYWQTRLLCYRRAMQSPMDGEDTLLAQLVAELRRTDGEPLEPDQQDRLTTALLNPDAHILTAGANTAAAVWQAVTALERVTPTILDIARDESREPLTTLGPWAAVLDPERLDNEPEDATLGLLTRLLTLDAATWLLADAASPGTSQEIRLAQLSLGIDHHFARESLTPDDKVAGSELHRFGGFLKRSWRINDWIWGRLDAVQMLCRLVLDPQRLGRVQALTGDTAEDMVARLLASSYDGTTMPDDDRFLRLRDDATNELRNLVAGEPGSGDRGYLPALARLAAQPIQQRIIVEELPALAVAIEADLADGASTRSRGRRFLDEHQVLLDEIRAADGDAWHLHGVAALTAFDRAGIGREPLDEEASSDALIRTTVTTAATVVTVADSENLGVKALRPVTKLLRGGALVPYWLVTALTSGSSAARFLALLGFAVGGVVLTLSLLGVLGSLSAAGATLGTGVLLAALAFAALRSGTLLHGVVLLAPAVPLVAFAFEGTTPSGDDSGINPVASVATVLAVALGLILLASLPNPLRSPLGSLRATSPKLGPTLGRLGAALLLLGVVAAVAVVVTREPGSSWSSRELVSQVSPTWNLAVTAAAVVGACLGGWFRGRGMRRWTRPPDEHWALEPAVSHPAGVSAGWAAGYGMGYLGLSWALGLWIRASDGGIAGAPSWLVVTLVWWVALGLVLCLAGPFWITWRARRRVAVPARPSTEEAFRDALERRDQLFSYLVATSQWRGWFVGTLADAPRLNRRGRKLFENRASALVEP